MPRVGKGINSTYPVENMIAAVEAVREGASIREASAKFGVPRSTLGDRITGRIAVEARPGKDPVIPIDIEDKMVEKAFSCANQGFGVSKKTLTARAGSLCRSLGLKNNFTKGIPGKAWWKCFRTRHPEIALRKPEKLSTVRSKAINGPVVGSYFLTLHDLIKKPDIAPSCVWNMDETSLSLEHTPTNVVAKKGSKVIPGRTANSKESITILPCINAAGGKMPPLIIVKGKTSRSLRAFNSHEGPEGAFWTFQAKAYMDDDMGTVWFRDVFYLTAAMPVHNSLLWTTTIHMKLLDCWRRHPKTAYTYLLFRRILLTTSVLLTEPCLGRSRGNMILYAVSLWQRVQVQS